MKAAGLDFPEIAGINNSTNIMRLKISNAGDTVLVRGTGGDQEERRSKAWEEGVMFHAIHSKSTTNSEIQTISATFPWPCSRCFGEDGGCGKGYDSR